MDTPENNVKLLWDCANTLNTETHTKKLLKCYYLKTCREIYEDQLQMPKEKFSPARMCSRCSCFWSENDFELKLRSQQIKNTGKVAKLIKKLEEMKNPEKKGLLTGKQKRRAKWLKKRATSSIEIICKTCQHKMLLPLQKPKKILKQQKDIEAIEASNDMPKTKLKKKKKHKNKDNKAGLNIAKPINQLQIVNLASKPKIKTEIHIKSEPNDDTRPAAVNKNVKSNTSKTVNAKPLLLKPTVKTKARKNKSKLVAKPSVVTPKFQSKTQQQNSLLQLAALLKTQSNKTPKNTQENRLKALLK